MNLLEAQLGRARGSVVGLALGGRKPRRQKGARSMPNNLLIALSWQTALQRELDVVSNNIANLNTTGYKGDNSAFSEYLMPVARAEQFAFPDRQLSFVQDRATWHNFSQGPLQQTGSPLDVAIDGDGFLVVQTARGERYTRNGALQINNAGELVTITGDRVLGESGPIILQTTDRDIVVNPDGTIKVREGLGLTSDSTRGKLRLVNFSNPQSLQKDGTSMFAAPANVAAQPDQKSRIVQGMVEKSNVHAVLEMTRMVQVTRHYTEVANMIQQQSDLRRNAIQQLAEVPA
jgi:flagellar basal-body rod protein FlgF